MELSGVYAGYWKRIPAIPVLFSIFRKGRVGIWRMFVWATKNAYGIPCRHMVAVVKSCCIEGLTQVNGMPSWWMTAHWRKQYPEGT